MLYQLSYTPPKKRDSSKSRSVQKRGRPLFSSYERGAALYEARTAEQAKNKGAR